MQERIQRHKFLENMRLWGLFIFLFACAPIYAQNVDNISIELTSNPQKDFLRSVYMTRDSAVIRVNGKNGLPKRELKESNLIIHSNGDTAEILSLEEVVNETTQDIAISFIFDNSSSMFSAYDSLTKYADRFIDSLSDGFIANALTFDDIERKPSFETTQRGTMYIAMTGFTSERETLKDFWHFYDTVRSKYTPLNDGLLAALEQIRYRRLKTKDTRMDIIILVTDGADNASKTTLSTLQELINALGVKVYTLSFHNEPNGKLNYLARKTGGTHFDCNYLQSLRNVLESIRRNTTYAYKLTYRFPFRGAVTPR